MKRNLLALVVVMVLINLPYYSKGQEIVVNELFYTSGSGGDGEYYEYLVLQDNLNLANYLTCDNNNGTTQWQTQVEFKNNALIRKLRRGTWVVISNNYSGGTQGSLASGVVVLPMPPSDNNSPYGSNAYLANKRTTAQFDLAAGGDFVQIVRPDGSMVHALGYSATTGGSAGASSVCVPGANCIPSNTPGTWTHTSSQLSGTPPSDFFTFNARTGVSTSNPSQQFTNSNTSDYSAGYLTRNTTIAPILNNETFAHGSTTANIQFIVDSLRAPRMDTQTICFTHSTNGNKLVFNGATDALNNDPDTRYLIVMSTNGQFTASPTSGKEYTVGATIGSAKVVGIINHTGGASASQTFTHTAGLSNASYRIYGIRFTGNSPNLDNGAAYNTYNYIKTSSGAGLPFLTQAGTQTGAICLPATVSFTFTPTGLPNYHFEVSSLTKTFTPKDTVPTSGSPVTVNLKLPKLSANDTVIKVKLTQLLPCPDSSLLYITVYSAPNVTEIKGSKMVCNTSVNTYHFTPNPNSNYRWAVDTNYAHILSGAISDSAITLKFKKDTSYLPLSLFQTYRGTCKNQTDSSLQIISVSKIKYPDTLKVKCDTVKISSTSLTTAFIGLKFRWSPKKGLSDSTVALPTFNGTQSGLYKVYYTNKNNCQDSAKVYVSYQKCDENVVLPPDTVILYTAFTPGLVDGKNDFLEVKNLSLTKESNLEVYNRWGKKVLSRSPYDNKWNGDDLPAGIYYYSFSYTRKDKPLTIQTTGRLTLIKD